jgi:hypothetical protein
MQGQDILESAEQCTVTAAASYSAEVQAQQLQQLALQLLQLARMVLLMSHAVEVARLKLHQRLRLQHRAERASQLPKALLQSHSRQSSSSSSSRGQLRRAASLVSPELLLLLHQVLQHHMHLHAQQMSLLQVMLR